MLVWIPRPGKDASLLPLLNYNLCNYPVPMRESALFQRCRPGLSVSLSVNYAFSVSPSRTLLASPPLILLITQPLGGISTALSEPRLGRGTGAALSTECGGTRSRAPDHAHPRSPVPPLPHPEDASVDEDTGCSAVKTKGALYNCKCQYELSTGHAHPGSSPVGTNRKWLWQGLNPEHRCQL